MLVDSDVRIMLEPFCVSKNERQSAVKILLKLKGQFLVMEIQHEYQAFLGKKGKMEAKKGESWRAPPSKISSPLAP